MAFSKNRLTAANAAVTNHVVTSVNMKVGAYVVANGTMPTTPGARRVTVTHAIVAAGTDTLGTVAVTGTDLRGNVVTDTITPLAGTIATGVLFFVTVTDVVGTGWVIAGGNDTLTVGVEAGSVLSDTSGQIYSVIVNTTAAGAVSLADSTGTFAALKTSIAEGVYIFRIATVGFLRVTLAAGSDVTIVHSGVAPLAYV